MANFLTSIDEIHDSFFGQAPEGLFFGTPIEYGIVIGDDEVNGLSERTIKFRDNAVAKMENKVSESYSDKVEWLNESGIEYILTYSDKEEFIPLPAGPMAYRYRKILIILFNNEDDALLFKLTFGGSE